MPPLLDDAPVVEHHDAVGLLLYGKICCFSHEKDERIGTKDLHRLQAMARILGEKLESSGAGELELQPMDSRQR